MLFGVWWLSLHVWVPIVRGTYIVCCVIDVCPLGRTATSRQATIGTVRLFSSLGFRCNETVVFV